MKNCLFIIFLLECFFVFSIRAEDLDDIVKQSIFNYAGKIDSATDELNSIRERVSEEKILLLDETRELENRLLELRARSSKLKLEKDQAKSKHAFLKQSTEKLATNVSYLVSLYQDGIRGMDTSMVPGESLAFSKPLQGVLDGFESVSRESSVDASVFAAGLLAKRIDLLIGGYSVEGSSISEDGEKVFPGEFAFFGPESFFLSSDGSIQGTVRVHHGSSFPISYQIPGWSLSDAKSALSENGGIILVDVTGGKALKLSQIEGGWVMHVKRGGTVGYIIIAFGFFALVTGLLKLVDIRKLLLDSPVVIKNSLNTIVLGSRKEADTAIRKLKKATQDLYMAGFMHMDKPKELLEEHLYAWILLQRIHHERKLPLLRVIAAAAPLLGLLGTVVGMVKTFTLITVFGTGDAEKLSSGISQALITTELGLIVAIPTLVLYGFLANKTQRSLSLLEQYSVEFVAASEGAKILKNKND